MDLADARQNDEPAVYAAASTEAPSKDADRAAVDADNAKSLIYAVCERYQSRLSFLLRTSLSRSCKDHWR